MIRYSHDAKLAHLHYPKQQSVIQKPYVIEMNRERDNCE